MHSRQYPFTASLIERKKVNKAGSDKDTFHLVFDLTDSGIEYESGDSVGIIPKNSPELVKKTLNALKITGEEKIVPKGTNQSISLVDYLTTQANISSVNHKLFEYVLQNQNHASKKEHLLLLKDDMKENLQPFELWDFLGEHSEVTIEVNKLTELLSPLLPRFYSIASSQKYVGNEVHILLAPINYVSRGYERKGVCTHYLCDLVPLGKKEVSLFIQEAHTFHLPQDPHASIIMIGPGTGVAPFRAFIQERLHHFQSKGKHWLFFGGRRRSSDFFYEDEWKMWQDKGHFKVDTAFSRDQETKIYVQDRMLEHGAELFSWLEEGSYLFVCGDASRMAKDVESTLQKIIEIHGKKKEQEAKEYIKFLRKQKRYLRDVY